MQMMDIDDHEERGNWIQHLITKAIILKPPYFGSKSDYESLSNFKNKLIFIEREKNNQSADNYIPCLFYRNPKSSNYLIYFHGNSEHIFQIEFYGLDFRSYLDMNVIIVEYPGYSIYPCDDPESNIFFKNSLIVYDWIKEKFNAKDEQIFICGRSIGTGSAIYLASRRQPKALFLISAFTSLKNIGRDLWVSYFVEEIFNSYRYITNITNPILFIHGMSDSLINYSHSQQLYNEMKINNKKIQLILRENMTHNEFRLKEDIILPIKDFIEKNELKSNDNNIIDLSEEQINDLYKIPIAITKKVDSKLFVLNNFEFNKNIETEIKSIFAMKTMENSIVFTSGSKILMYNQKNYSLEEELDINSNSIINTKINIIDEMINTLFQMKNKNLVCGTNLGNIIIFEKDPESEEYKTCQPIELKEKIYKIEHFKPNLICILTENNLFFYDELFNEKKPIYVIKLIDNYFNFVQIFNDYLAMLSNDHLDIFHISGNELQKTKTCSFFKLNSIKNNLILTNKYIIIGGQRCIYYLNYTKYLSNEQMKEYPINSGINYIYKIHDEFFLASTENGSILQININNNSFQITEKFCTDNPISSIFMKNYKTILLTGDNKIQVWNNPTSDKSSCSIY